MVTVTAGAGWGKTTLLEQWSAGARRSYPVVSVSASDPEDSHRSFAAALDRAFHRDAGGAPGSQSGPLAIVVDDVHLLESHADRETLERLAVSLGRHETLILCGRSQPLSANVVAAGRRLTLLGSSDLALTFREVDDLLRLAGVALDPADLGDLVGHTQGWAFSLALFRHVVADAADPSAEVARFTRDSGLLADYLVGALLESLPTGTQSALLALAVVDEVSIPLAVELTGMPDIGTVLERLCVATSLLRRRPGAADGPHYDYIDLLREHLVAELRRRDAARVLELHETAAGWFVENGEFRLGLEQAVRAESVELVHRLLRLHGLGLVFSGDTPTVHQALAMLEDRGILTHTTGMLAVLLNAPYLLDSVRIDHFVRLAGEAIESNTATSRVLYLAVLVMRAHTEPEIRERMQQLADTVAEAGSSPDDSASAVNTLDARIFAEAARALGLLRLGEPGECVQVAVSAAGSADATGRPWLTMMLLDIAANAAAQQGAWALQLSLENRVAAHTREGATPHDLVSAHSQFSVASAAYQACEPYSAARLTDIVQTEWRSLDPGLSLPPRVLQVLFQLDSEPNPRPLYDEMERLLGISLTKHPRTLAAGAFRYIDLTLRYRGRASAREAVGTLSGVLGEAAFEVQLANAQIRAGSALQEAEEETLLAALVGHPLAWHGSSLVFGWTLLAGWAAESGREEQTLSWLGNALALAERMNARRPFLAAGGEAARLVEERLGAFGASEGFAASVVEAARRVLPPAPAITLTPVLLTPREHDLLRELPLHQSVIDIARKHSVSPNTVKTHLRSIYQKLGAGDRSSAVENARKVGLL